jgi:hypothetical protein
MRILTIKLFSMSLLNPEFILNGYKQQVGCCIEQDENLNAMPAAIIFGASNYRARAVTAECSLSETAADNKALSPSVRFCPCSLLSLAPAVCTIAWNLQTWTRGWLLIVPSCPRLRTPFRSGTFRHDIISVLHVLCLIFRISDHLLDFVIVMRPA